MKHQLLEDALQRLEWPRITAALADCATLPAVHKKLLSLAALESREHRSYLFACQREIRQSEASKGGVRIRPFESEGLLPQIRRSSVLGLEALWQTLCILENMHDVALFVKSGRQSNRHLELPNLFELLSQIKNEPDLHSRLKASVDEKPSLLSTASPALRGLRSKVDNAKRKVEDQLGELLKKSHIREALQDTVWTQRDGRYVLPVRSDRKSDVTGTARGVSSSGSTIFVEPAELSAAQFQLEHEQTQMQLEEARIMRELSELCHLRYESLANAVSLIEIYDGIRARAVFADKLGAVEPLFHGDRNQKPAFTFGKAVHPFFILDSKKAFANDMSLQKNILVISGPNAGGKTVAMKTAALLIVMALSGLCVTATHGLVYEFDSLCIEMGDRQNISDDLSTFSGHLVQIQKILNDSSEKTFIVLDEGFVGTDPTLGVALARATLETLADLGATVIITTHFSGLKSLADEDSRFQNASLEFEPQGLRPTYRLLADIPGQSFAIELATRLGMPQSLLTKARHYAGEESLRVEKLLTELATKRDELDKTLNQQKTELLALSTERSQLENYTTEISQLKNDLAHRMQDRFQKRFNVFENQLSIRERQFERAKKQELVAGFIQANNDGSPVTQNNALGSLQPSKNESFLKIGTAKRTSAPTEEADNKQKPLTGFDALSGFQFPNKTKENWNESKLTATLPPKIRERNVTQMTTRDLLDEASESLEEMRSGWHGEAGAFVSELETLDEMVQARSLQKKKKPEKQGHANQPPPPGITPKPPAPIRTTFQKGDRVRNVQFKEPGTVLSPADNKGRIECQFGLVKIKLPADQLESKIVNQSLTKELSAKQKKEPSKNGGQNWEAYKKKTSGADPQNSANKSNGKVARLDTNIDGVMPHKGNSLDVRGALVDTALDRVEDFLDRCWRDDVSPLVLIHGHGTGKVKQAIREFLNTCAYKIRWRPGSSGEGADGATIVVMDEA